MAPLDSRNLCRCYYVGSHDPRRLHLLGIPNLIESVWVAIPNQRLCCRYNCSLSMPLLISRELSVGGSKQFHWTDGSQPKPWNLSYGKTMRKIILPQAAKLMLQTLARQFVIAKMRRPFLAIGLVELFQTGKDHHCSKLPEFQDGMLSYRSSTSWLSPC